MLFWELTNAQFHCEAHENVAALLSRQSLLRIEAIPLAQCVGLVTIVTKQANFPNLNQNYKWEKEMAYLSPMHSTFDGDPNPLAPRLASRYSLRLNTYKRDQRKIVST